MTDLIKRFIEENIEFIEKQEWYNLFYSWYMHFGDNNTSIDARNLRELTEALEIVYPDFGFEAKHAQQEVLLDKMEQYINDCVQVGIKQIRYTSCIDSLSSLFGIHEFFLKSTFKQAAENCGFELGRNYIIEVE